MTAKYRNPRFSVCHMAALGSLQLHTGTLVSGTLDRLRDRLSRRPVTLAKYPGSDIVIVDADQGNVQPKTTINRLLIPAGHNFKAQRGRLQLAHSPDDITYTTLSDAEGHSTRSYYAAPHVIDIEIAEENDQWLRLIVAFDYAAWTDAIFGELWWTRSWQPVDGIAQDWEAESTSNNAASVSRFGNEYTLNRGPDKRRWVMEHQRCSYADDLGYQWVKDCVGIDGRAFWYDPPDSGNAKLVVDPMDDTSEWVPQNATIAAVGGGWANGTCLEVTSTSTLSADIERVFAETQDWRDCDMSIDVFSNDASTFVIGGNSIRMFLQSLDPGQSDAYSQYDFGAYVTDQGSNWDGQWWRIFIELDKQNFQGSAGPVDLERVSKVEFRFKPTAAGQVVRWDNLTVYDRRLAPRLVRLRDFSRRQASPVPSAQGPQYTWRLEMEEALE